MNEAFDYTKDKLGLYITDTKGLTLDTMNMINREIQKYYDMFGSLYEKDVLNGLRIVPGKKRYVAAYQKAMGEVILVKSNLTKKKICSDVRRCHNRKRCWILVNSC